MLLLEKALSYPFSIKLQDIQFNLAWVVICMDNMDATFYWISQLGGEKPE